MKRQKIINLFNDSSNEESKFATKKWYVTDSLTTKGKYMQSNTIKFKTETIKSDAFILVTGNITVAANNDADVTLQVQQKLMMYLLTKQVIFTLHCLCTI